MIRFATLAALCAVLFSTGAEARQHHRHHHHIRHHHSHHPHAAAAYAVDPGCNVIWPCQDVTTSARGERIVEAMGGFGTARKIYTPSPRQPAYGAPSPVRQAVGRHSNLQGILAGSTSTTQILPHPASCPARAFCGCGASVHVFGHSVRNLWLASNWFRFPRSAPAPGMVAVRRHHVFVLEADLGGGKWRVFDANSGGGRTRVHARSLAGFAIVDPHGAG